MAKDCEGTVSVKQASPGVGQQRTELRVCNKDCHTIHGHNFRPPLHGFRRRDYLNILRRRGANPDHGRAVWQSPAHDLVNRR